MRRKEKELPFLGVFFPPLLLLWVVFLLLSLLLQHPWFLIWVRVEAEGNATISASAEGTFFSAAALQIFLAPQQGECTEEGAALSLPLCLYCKVRQKESLFLK